jgi:hypothetical protein
MSQDRHERRCTICKTPRRNEIEEAFVSWGSLRHVTKEYGVSRDAVYRHAHAVGLMEKRRLNVRFALERIIEKAGDVDVTASAVVSAVVAYAKINASGQWVERTDHINQKELFDRMTREEMELYAKDGTRPPWFEQLLGSSSSINRNTSGDEGSGND